VAKQAKQQEALLKCTQRKEKNDTYIFIDWMEYRDCDAMQKWLKEVETNWAFKNNPPNMAQLIKTMQKRLKPLPSWTRS
jgi:hypothetical protein